MANIPDIVRPVAGPVGQAAGLTGTRAAARRVDITPELGLGLAGHGPDTDRAHGAVGRLWANVLVIDDGQAERVALIAIDMMAGSRFLSERLAERVAGTTGLSVERIFLAGSHTHRAPGWIWGAGTYDRITATADLDQWDAHFDLVLADAIVGRLAGAVREACAALADPSSQATIGYGTAPAVGAAWNRSLEATMSRPRPSATRPDPDPAPGAPWKRPPHDTSEAHIRELHALLNGGMVDPGPPWFAAMSDGSPLSAEGAELLAMDFVSPEAARGALGEAHAAVAPQIDRAVRGMAPKDAAEVYRLAAAAPPQKAAELAADLHANPAGRMALVHELLLADDVDAPLHLKEIRRRFQAGDPTLTMDDILRAMLDPETGALQIAGFLGHIRKWVEGNGRWWDSRKEKWGERLVTDCRLHALSAFRADTGALIGAFCTFGATPSIVSAHAAVYCGDGFAAAVELLRQKRGDAGLAIGIAGGTLGDSNLCDPDRSAIDIKDNGKRIDELVVIMDAAAVALADALERALKDAAKKALTDVTLGVALAEPDPRSARFQVEWLQKDKDLPKHAAFGFSTLAASDLGKSQARLFMSEELFVEYRNGDPFPPTASEHLPKPQLPRFAFDPRPLPVRVITVTGTTPAGKAERIALAGLPAEISTLLGYEAATRLAAELGPGTRAFVAGPVGDYCSYFSTVWEYAAQHYEGASAPWGRWSGDWLVENLCTAASALPRPAPGTRATFSGAVGRPKRGLEGVKKVGGKDLTLPEFSHATLEPLDGNLLHVVGLRARGSWIEPPSASRDRRLWEGPLVELIDGSGAVVKTSTGLLADDVHVPTLIWCDEPSAGRRRWRWEMRLPPLGSAIAAVRVGSRGKTTILL